MRNNRPLAIMLLTIFIDMMGFGIIIPVLPNLVFELTGKTSTLWIAGLYALFNFIFAPFWGTLSDRYGRRPVMLVSILLTAAANLLFGFATAFWILIIQRALAGIGSANISTANAYVADVSTPEDRTKNMGYVGAAFGMGFVFGPAIGGFIGKYWHIMGIGVFSAALSLVNFGLAYFILPESLKVKNPLAKFELKPVTQLIGALKIGIMRELLVLNFLFTAAFTMMNVTAAIMWEKIYGLDTAERGFVFMFIGVASTLVQIFLVGPMNKRFGEQKLLYAGLILLVIGLGTMPLVPPDLFLLQLVPLAMLALSNGCITPGVAGLLSKMAKPSEQGKVMGVNQSAAALGRVFSPALGGALYELHFFVPYFTGAAIGISSLFIVADFARKRKAKAQEKEFAESNQANAG